MVQVIWPCGNVEFTDAGNCISQLDRGDWDFQRRERGRGERERRLELEVLDSVVAGSQGPAR